MHFYQDSFGNIFLIVPGDIILQRLCPVEAVHLFIYAIIYKCCSLVWLLIIAGTDTHILI